MELHVDYLRSLEESVRVRAACVSYLQNWLFHFFPERPDIVDKARELAIELGGELEVPHLSWKYEAFDAIFGRHIAKLAQEYLRGAKWSLLVKLDRWLFGLEGGKVGRPSSQAS